MNTPARLFSWVAFPFYIYAHSNGLPLMSTSPNIDGKQTCAQCHTGGMNGPGRVTLANLSAYTPGIAQTILVQITGETAQEFGFQLTARLVSDPTQETEAGYFLAVAPDSQVYSCSPKSSPPCSSDLEFATHTPNSISPTGVGTRTWRVIWVPPGRDLGDVHFYVAVVAGTASGPIGDRVYLQDIVVSTVACNVTASPQITTGPTGVEDAASFRGEIASNGLISIFGQGFSILGGPVPNTPATGNGYFYQKADLVSGSWPTELACVEVTVDGKPVPVYFVTDKQINAQAPIFPPQGEVASVVVILNPGTTKQIVSNTYSVNAFAVQPSLFTFGGSNNAAALNASKGYGYLADTSVVASGVSAAPGDIIEIFGTGFGPTNPSYLPGQFAIPPPAAALPQLTTTPFSVSIGGQTVPASDIKYAGLAFDAPGFYQVNVVVPDVPDGDQPILVTVGEASSQRNVTIPVKH